ncbi:hypothetical protein AC1031_012097 [Aphanomyces cochlioides]|nr:hypothetical protein AC1031_012097 [Aphanomyces cochlioides]
MRSVNYDIWSSTGRTFFPEATTPSLKATDSVRIQVKAAGVNPLNLKLPKWFLHGRGYGLEFAGIVAEVSPDVTSVAVGDRVFGYAIGSLADQLVCSPTTIAKLPPSFSFQEGAALSVNYVVGYQALANHGFEKGMKVLVIGASGGCGTVGVQLAKAMGASEVVGVSSKKNEEFVKSLGADRIVDYQSQSIVDGHARYFDFVYDTTKPTPGGENYLEAAKSVLKDHTKHHVTLNGTPWMFMSKYLGLSQDVVLVVADIKTAALESVLTQLGRSNRRPVIDSIFPFSPEGVTDAYTKLESRRARGKIVVDIAGDR